MNLKYKACLYCMFFSLLFSSCSAEQERLINLSNGNIAGVAHLLTFNPSDNKEIIFASEAGVLKIYNTEENKVYEYRPGKGVEGNLRTAAWSPDGRKIAYLHENNIYCLYLDTLETKQLTNGFEVWDPLVWKSKNEILFTKLGNSRASSSISVLNIRDLSFDEVISAKDGEYYSALAYLDNVNEIVFSYLNSELQSEVQIHKTKTTDDSFDTTEKPIFDGSKILREEDGYIAFSHSGKLMAFSGFEAGRETRGQELFIVNISSGKVTEILRDGNHNIIPIFSPSDDKIVFLGSTSVEGVSLNYDIKEISIAKYTDQN